MAPRWRLWALDRIDDYEAFKDEAIRVGLMWPDESIFKKTKFCGPNYDKKLATIMAKFDLTKQRKRIEIDPEIEATLKKQHRVFNAVLIVVAGGALFLLYAISTEVDLPFILAAKYLTIPMFIGSYLLVRKYPGIVAIQPKLSVLKTFVWTILCGSVFTLFSGPYLSLANAILPNQSNILIKGNIARKYAVTGRQRSYEIELDSIDYYGKPYVLPVSEYRYLSLKVGDWYESEARLGAFNIVYRWR